MAENYGAVSPHPILKLYRDISQKYYDSLRRPHGMSQIRYYIETYVLLQLEKYSKKRLKPIVKHSQLTQTHL
jgi:hypothetical protein